jgi:hypothetical protein
MPWLRGVIFTGLVPVVVAWLMPAWIDPLARPMGGWLNLGWLPIVAGTPIYALCLIRFLIAG